MQKSRREREKGKQNATLERPTPMIRYNNAFGSRTPESQQKSRVGEPKGGYARTVQWGCNDGKKIVVTHPPS
jgi:hypothetical protein